MVIFPKSNLTFRMMFNKYLILVAFCLALGSCANENPTPETQEAINNVGDHPTVYLAGQSNDEAVVWKNEAADTLASGSVAQSVFVDGNDTYVAGWSWNSAGTPIATYWKNGNAVTLADGTTDTWAKSIVVSGGDVYVAGFAYGNRVDARCWKNGVSQPLASGGATSTIAVSCFISGSDVYVAGWVFNLNGQPVAAYWKNGDLVLLTDGTSPCMAESIFVTGHDVYVAGTIDLQLSNTLPTAVFAIGTEGIATYWKNGKAVTLSSNGRAQSIFVNGPDVYVSGSIYSTDVVGLTPGGSTFGDLAVYWKNGNVVKLVNDKNSDAYSISVTNHGDVYTAGTVDNQAVYWINNDAQHLPIPVQGQGYLYSIFLTN